MVISERKSYNIKQGIPLRIPLFIREDTEFDYYELRIFQHGQHGMGIRKSSDSKTVLQNLDYTNADLWIPLCANWLRGVFDIEKRTKQK